MALRIQFLLIFIAFSLVACKATPTSEHKQEQLSENLNAQVPPGSVKVSFKKQAHISNVELEKIDELYDELSIEEYYLNEHSLFKFMFHNSVLFEFDRSDLNSVNVDEIKDFARTYAKKDIGKHLFILGHTDSRGRSSYNMGLGMRRSVVIANLLVKEGIPSERIKIVPVGETLPIESNNTDIGRKKNRRVEILGSDSKELVKAFLREWDCNQVDVACKRSVLAIYDLKANSQELLVNKRVVDNVVTQAPQLNDLAVLSARLTSDFEQTDFRYSTNDDQRRLLIVAPELRAPLAFPLTVREPFAMPLDVRKPLILPPKYHYNPKKEK